MDHKRLSIGQLLIQWTASQWIKLVVQKQRQWLANYLLDKILNVDCVLEDMESIEVG
jgi:hypothetical protein